VMTYMPSVSLILARWSSASSFCRSFAMIKESGP
jgi:hypothetical protein